MGGQKEERGMRRKDDRVETREGGRGGGTRRGEGKAERRR